MISPELQSKIDSLVSKEFYMAMLEAEHMAVFQIKGYPGFKRQHRYLQRWRNESALCVLNFVIDNYGYKPIIAAKFNSAGEPLTLESAITSLIREYELLHELYVNLSRSALSENRDELNQLAQEKICWISKTIMKYRRDLVETTGKTPEYIQIRSENLHEKYRKKESDFRL
jgi:hypothetical protein